MEDIRHCENCENGVSEIICGNGITEPPYLKMIRCIYETEYYKYPDDFCSKHQKKSRGRRRKAPYERK